MKYSFVLFITLIFATKCLGQTAQDVLDYRIPRDSVRGRKGESLLPGYTIQEIFPPGTDLTPRRTEGIPVVPKRIAYEEYFEGHLVEQILYRNLRRFGVTRKWHANGQLAAEEPYRDDMMDGLFRQWDDKGRLVAQYVIQNGDGTKTVYKSSGELFCEMHFVKGKEDGWCFESSKRSETQWIRFYVNGWSRGIALDFDRDWRITKAYSYSRNSIKGESHGPEIRFETDGAVAWVEWYLNGKKVPEAEYAEAVAKDPSLPPYYVDKSKYREITDPDALAAMQHYRNLPRVKIPLEFDAQGNPVPAEPASNRKQ